VFCQALADLATFREYFVQSRSMGADTPVIVFGGSYSGALSAFFRTKYPHLAIAAVATSAPVLALTDFYQYQDVVAQSLATAPQVATLYLSLLLLVIGFHDCHVCLFPRKRIIV
jgi:alpha-beta hydrolase superfamily lysophospholipase